MFVYHKAVGTFCLLWFRIGTAENEHHPWFIFKIYLIFYDLQIIPYKLLVDLVMVDLSDGVYICTIFLFLKLYMHLISFPVWAGGILQWWVCAGSLDTGVSLSCYCFCYHKIWWTSSLFIFKIGRALFLILDDSNLIYVPLMHFPVYIQFKCSWL